MNEFPGIRKNPETFRHGEIEVLSAGILENLVGIEGERTNLVNLITTNKRIAWVFMSGEPGIGKTTITRQLVHALAKENIVANVLTHDQMLTETEPLYGPSEKWRKKQWRKYNYHFKKRLKELEKDAALEEAQDGKRHIILCDIVGIAGENNRARQVLKKYVKRKKGRVLVVAGAPIVGIQQLASGRRYATHRVNPENVERILWEAFKIHVEWEDGGPNSAKEKGEILQEIDRRSAPKEAIYTIHQESVRYVQRKKPNSLIIINTLATALSNRPILRQIGGDAEFVYTAAGILQLQLRMEELYRLGLPKENGIYFLNLTAIEPICWFIWKKINN